MKKLNYLLSAVVLLAVLVTVGCGGDDGPGITPEQAVTDRLAKTWVLSSVTFDEDATDLINPTALTLTINSNLGYTTNSASVDRTPNPWPASGTWEFKTDITDAASGSFVITRDDGLDINVTLADTSLTLGFIFDDNVHASGRGEAVSGNWTMTFDAQ